ncbi:hypothetical protein N478_07340 [Pseudoalteromonas luteoviolacea S4060-1]|uniref:Uncharacterized protein n=1 Tax=Pseudoalteromonas luteoviolacea S4060-1 TaxID=1365257 RepID=A0A167J168_9GAMM|nr:hypothetical protein N478_07340 [Pseudoalteromonas luteoviolacea S4060-1]
MLSKKTIKAPLNDSKQKPTYMTLNVAGGAYTKSVPVIAVIVAAHIALG